MALATGQVNRCLQKNCHVKFTGHERRRFFFVYGEVPDRGYYN